MYPQEGRGDRQGPGKNRGQKKPRIQNQREEIRRCPFIPISFSFSAPLHPAPTEFDRSMNFIQGWWNWFFHPTPCPDSAPASSPSPTWRTPALSSPAASQPVATTHMERTEFTAFLTSPLWRWTHPVTTPSALSSMTSASMHVSPSTSSLMKSTEEEKAVTPPYDTREFPVVQFRSYALLLQHQFPVFLDHVGRHLGLNSDTVVNSLQAAARRFQNLPPVGVALTDVDMQDAFLAFYCRELTEVLQNALQTKPNFLLTNMGMNSSCNQFLCYPVGTAEVDRHRFALSIMTFLFDSIPRFKLNYPRPLEAFSLLGAWQKFFYSSDFYLASEHPHSKLSPYWLYFQTQPGPNPFWSWPHPDSVHADPETFSMPYQGATHSILPSDAKDLDDDSCQVPQLAQPSLHQIPRFHHPKGQYPYRFVYLVDFWYNQLYYTEWAFTASSSDRHSSDKRLGPCHGLRLPPVFRLASTFPDARQIGTQIAQQRIVPVAEDVHGSNLLMVVRYLIPSPLMVSPLSVRFEILQQWFPYQAGVVVFRTDS